MVTVYTYLYTSFPVSFIANCLTWFMHTRWMYIIKRKLMDSSNDRTNYGASVNNINHGEVPGSTYLYTTYI